MYELLIDPTQLNREYLTVCWPYPLGHPAPLKKYRLTPAIVTTGRDFNTIRLAYGLLVWRQDVRIGN